MAFTTLIHKIKKHTQLGSDALKLIVCGQFSCSREEDKDRFSIYFLA